MLREAGGDVRVGGNIGRPVTRWWRAPPTRPSSCSRCRASSSRASTRFHPQVAVFLNLSADHLDRHPSFEAYAQAKARIFAQPGPRATGRSSTRTIPAVLRAGRARARAARAVLPGAPAAADGAFFAGGEARLRRDGSAETLFRRERGAPARRAPGAGPAGRGRRRAAAGRARRARSRRAVRAFRGVEHVLEHVAEIGGVAFFNDSKATNVDAARKSLEAFARPRARDPGRPLQGRRLRGARARARAPRHGGAGHRRGARAASTRALGAAVPVVACASLREAVERGLAARAPGDTVLLAPACSSFDMFRDYAERGRAFKDEVRRPADPARERGWLRSSPRDTTLFAVTVALLGLGPGDGVERLLACWPRSATATPTTS